MACQDELQGSKEPFNQLFEEVSSMQEKLDNVLKNTNNICQDMDQFCFNQLSSRLTNPSLPVGNTNAQLMVSLKQLADSIFQFTRESSFTNGQDALSANLAIAEDNLERAADSLQALKMTTYQLERLYEAISKSVEEPLNTQDGTDCSSDFNLNISASSPL